MHDLSSGTRLSFRGTANELRETLREVLDHLAPDEEVMKVEGFKLEQGRTAPTHKQKVRFILKWRGLSKTAAIVPENAIGLADELTASLSRSIYDRSSLSAHVAGARSEVKQMKMYVDGVLGELLQIHK